MGGLAPSCLQRVWLTMDGSCLLCKPTTVGRHWPGGGGDGDVCLCRQHCFSHICDTGPRTWTLSFGSVSHPGAKGTFNINKSCSGQQAPPGDLGFAGLWTRSWLFCLLPAPVRFVAGEVSTPGPRKVRQTHGHRTTPFHQPRIPTSRSHMHKSPASSLSPVLQILTETDKKPPQTHEV